MSRPPNPGKLPSPAALPGPGLNWRIGLRRLILSALILGLVPLWPTPQPVHAGGIIGKVSKVVPFAGFLVGWSQRNRVYRSSERFISDRNQYYDGLKDMASQQMKGNTITTIGRTRAAAYIKVYAMIEQERAGQLAAAEARKRQARTQFQERVKETILYAVAGGRAAQEIIGSMLNGVDSMQGLVDRAVGKITTGGSDLLGDLRRIKDIASTLEQVSIIVGGKAGTKIALACGRIANAIEQAEMGVVEAASLVTADLGELRDQLFILKEIGRKPTAGEVIDQVKGKFLPGSSEGGSIPLEAIASILSELKAGDGSLKDEARRILNAGYAARCAEHSLGITAQLEALRNSGQEGVSRNPAAPLCKDVNPKRQGQQTEGSAELDELLEFEEDDKEELPRVTASGTISEAMSGALNSTSPMGTTFQLTADFEAGTISGTLKGSRTSTPGGWMNCFDPDNPSVEFDRIDVNTTESYQATFSGAIDKETGEFSISIAPVGQTSATKVSLFTHERCLNLNSKKYSGDQGWNGAGTISGGVSKDGGIELSTSWTYSWFKGEVQVNGQWSGNGIVSSPTGGD